MSDQKKRFEVGDKVTWMDSTKRGSSINFRTKEGKVVGMDGHGVVVQKGNGRKETVSPDDLTPASEKNQVTRVFEAIAGQEVGSKQRTQAQ